MFVQRLFIIVAALFMVTLPACTREEAQKIDLSKTEIISREKEVGSHASRIAVGGMITPKEGFAYYREFLDFIGKELGRPVEYVDATSYEEINTKLESRDIEGAIVCSGPYVDGHQKFGLELLA